MRVISQFTVGGSASGDGTGDGSVADDGSVAASAAAASSASGTGAASGIVVQPSSYHPSGNRTLLLLRGRPSLYSNARFLFWILRGSFFFDDDLGSSSKEIYCVIVLLCYCSSGVAYYRSHFMRRWQPV